MTALLGASPSIVAGRRPEQRGEGARGSDPLLDIMSSFVYKGFAYTYKAKDLLMVVILPDVPGMLRIRFSGTVLGHPWNNLFYAKYVGTPGTQAQINTLANALRTAWGASWAATQATTDSLTQTQVWDLSGRANPSGLNTTVLAGTRTPNSQLPANCAGVVSWTVNYRWRGGHFRTYLPGLMLADVSGGSVLAGAYTTLVGGAATNWETQLAAINYQGGPLQFWGVRYYSNKELLQTPLQVQVIGHKVRARMDSMRRRLGKETG